MHQKKKLKYDEKDPKSIYEYAKKLIGQSLRDTTSAPDLHKDSHAKTVKGKFGQYLEKYYFEFENNSESRPDFEKIGLELKSNPLKKLRDGKIVAKERIILNIIDYVKIIEEDWEGSHFLSKNQFILFVMYLYEKDKNFLDFLIKYVQSWKIEGKDREIIKQDWEKIVKKIKDGKAHELSEGDTFYLGACRKGWKEGLRKQPNSNIGAPQRAFSFKQKYVNAILTRIKDAEVAIKDISEIEEEGFEGSILNKFNPFKRLEVKEIEEKLNIKLNLKSKNYYATLARRMLGVSKKKIVEFEKADVTMKIIRLRHNELPKESMSFPYFKYKDVAMQDWEESEFHSQLEKKFFLVIYKMNKDETKVRFQKAFFWNIPYEDLQEAKKVWIETKKRINDKNSENLPKKSENKVSHVRPHAKDKSDTDETPYEGEKIKKGFWLNNTYLKEQIDKNGY